MRSFIALLLGLVQNLSSFQRILHANGGLQRKETKSEFTARKPWYVLPRNAACCVAFVTSNTEGFSKERPFVRLLWSFLHGNGPMPRSLPVNFDPAFSVRIRQTCSVSA